MGKRKRLFVKDLMSVGVVDEGDNPAAHIGLWKRRNPSNPPPQPPSVSKIDTLNPDRDDDTRTNTMETLDLSTLDDTAKAAVAKAMDDRDTRIAELEKTIADTAEPPTVDDVIKGLPDDVQKRFVELEKAAEAQTVELAKERDARLTTEWVGKARAFEAVLGDAEKAGPMLKQVAETDAADWLLEKLQAAAVIIEKSPLFKELGGSETASAADEIETLAKLKRTEDTSLSMPQAKSLVRKENPELKRREREEGGS